MKPKLLSDSDIRQMAITLANKKVEEYTVDELKQFVFDALVDVEIERINEGGLNFESLDLDTDEI